MNSATIALIIQFIQAAIGAAPQITAIAKQAKEFITELFNKGEISVEQQNSLHAHVDAIVAAIATGKKPPQWEVEADPS